MAEELYWIAYTSVPNKVGTESMSISGDQFSQRMTPTPFLFFVILERYNYPVSTVQLLNQFLFNIFLLQKLC